MTTKQLPLGTSDFKTVIEHNQYYVDKTAMITEVINGAAVTLIPRPRRFGKTLNMSMLYHFFSNEVDNRHLFRGLAIENNAEAMTHLGQYPAIHLSFKDVKFDKYADCMAKFSSLIQRLFLSHKYLKQSSVLDAAEISQFNRYIEQQVNSTELSESILLLSQFLSRHHNKPVVVIIDEYDMPINSAYTHGYYEEMVGFLRNLLSGAFKDNPAVFKGVMTGILRIARESIFSGLNNIDVCSLITEDFNYGFGFTEAETEQLLVAYSLNDKLADVRAWYNGYNFGGVTIYNPWSILNFVKRRGDLAPYWLNTSDNALVRDLIAKAPVSVKQELETLLSDKNAVVKKPLNEHVAFRDIHLSEGAVWNFLLFSGYLAYQHKVLEGKRFYAELCIPNLEVETFYEDSVLAWFETGNDSSAMSLPAILGYLLNGDLDSFSRAFTHFSAETFSYFDVQGKQPERFYHAFVLGMLVQLQQSHTIRSNRESGFGRYDVCVIPHDKTQAGFVFEFKAVDEYEALSLEQACEAALKQIGEKNYVTELNASGVEMVHSIAIAFEGKKSLVRFG